MRKGAYAALFLLFFLSCSSPPSPWKREFVEACSKEQESRRLLYREGLVALEFLFAGDEMHAFLSVTSLPIASCEPNSGKALLTAAIEGSPCEEIELRLFRGHQKALLPDEWGRKIFAALQSGKTVALTFGRYRATILVPPAISLAGYYSSGKMNR